MRRTRRPQGFTLVELLVVIAIILVLAAILFPVFARAIDKAKATACLSNLKQIGLAVRMYADDYDGLAPITRGMVGSLTEFQDSWAVRVGPYMRNADMLQCPGFRTRLASWQMNWWVGQCKYGLNLNCARDYNNWWSNPGYVPKNLDPSDGPVSQVPLVFCWWDGANGGGKQTGPFGPNGTILSWFNSTGHHNDQMEYICWLDGHAKPVRTELLKTTEVVWDPWP